MQKIISRTAVNTVVRFLFVAMLCAGVGSYGYGQSAVDGAIGGTVQDPSGLAVPNAKVVIRNNATNAEQTVLSDDSDVEARLDTLLSLVKEDEDARQEHLEVPIFVRVLGIHAGARVLEIGCGRGIALPAISRLCRPSRLVGVDIDDSLLDEAKGNTTDIDVELVCADVRALPFPAEAFDVVIDFGTSYKPSPHQQLDLHCNFGLSSAAPGPSIGFGYSFRFQVFRSR